MGQIKDYITDSFEHIIREEVYSEDSLGKTFDIQRPALETDLQLANQVLVFTDSGNVYYKTDDRRSPASAPSHKPTLFNLRRLANGEDDSYLDLNENNLPPLTIGKGWNIPDFSRTTSVQQIMLPRIIPLTSANRSDLPISPFQHVREIRPFKTLEDLSTARRIARTTLSRLQLYW